MFKDYIIFKVFLDYSLQNLYLSERPQKDQVHAIKYYYNHIAT